MKRTLLLILLALAVALAGCADQGGDGTDGDGDGAVGPQMSNAEAEALFTRAADNMPDRFGFAFEAKSANGSQLMTMEGAFDNATQRAYLELKGDPAAFGEAADEEAQDFFREGFSVYTTPEGSLYLVNGTAFVFPPGEEDDDGFVPSPEDSPVGEFLDPETFLAGISGEEGGINVTSVRPLSYRGKAAIEVAFTSTQEGETMEGKAILFTSPERLAHVEVDNLGGGSEGTPLDQATFVGDFYYDDEAQVQIPTEVQRALGLAYESDASPFGGSEGPVTWTFLIDGGIALSEVEVVAKSADAAASGEFDIKGAPTLWTFALTDGNATHEGVTIAFNDADADGKVSQGDTLVVTVPEDAEMPSLVLHDKVTDIYVVPGPALALVAALLGALALAMRRR